MEEVLACRACLGTDGKLYNMHSYDLVPAYETITGLQISNVDGHPQQICSYCASLLLKYAAFRQKCINAQQLLDYAIVEEHQISLAYLLSIDRQTHNLALPYTTTTNVITIKQEDLTTDNDLTSLFHNIIEQSDVKVEESDEEPLVKFVKKSKKRRKKLVAKDTAEEQSQDLKDLPQEDSKVSIIKAELDDLILPYDECFNDNDDDQFDDDSKPEFVCDDEIEVVILSHEEQLQELQSRKSSLNYTNSFYKCDMCYRGFMVEDTYQNHMTRHDPSFGRFSCDICHLRFPSARTQQQHKLATHSRNYTCRRCGHVCKAKSRAKEHYKWHRGVLYVCNVCGAAFDKPTSHLTHVRTHHPSRHICHVCAASFVSQHGLNMHCRKAHRQQGPESNPDYKCVLCGVQFNGAGALEKHLSLAHDNICDPALRPCIFCGDNFLNEEELKKHVTEHQDTEKNYVCGECNKSFSSARYHAAHYRRVHSRTQKTHRNKLHANAVCEICGKKCTSKATLVYHQRTHSGEKPYQCNECPKRFSVLQRLQIHTRTHTGERPCQCPHCPKAFKHKAALNRHLRVHTGAKPYSCPHCGKSFSQSNTMKGHVRSVHLKLPALYRRPKDYNE